MSQSRWINLVGLDARFMPQRKRQLASRPTPATNLDDVDRWTRRSRWKPFAVYVPHPLGGGRRVVGRVEQTALFLLTRLQ